MTWRLRFDEDLVTLFESTRFDNHYAVAVSESRSQGGERPTPAMVSTLRQSGPGRHPLNANMVLTVAGLERYSALCTIKTDNGNGVGHSCDPVERLRRGIANYRLSLMILVFPDLAVLVYASAASPVSRRSARRWPCSSPQNRPY